MALGQGARAVEDRSKVVNRVTPKHSWTYVPNVPFIEGRKRELDPSIRWPKLTVKWWNMLREMPHASLWSESDWQFAEETALVHKGFVIAGDKPSELRIRERLLGVTLEARNSLMIRYVEPDQAPALTAVAEVKEMPTKKRRIAAIDPGAK